MAILNINTQEIGMTPEQKLELWMAEESATLERLERGPGPGVAHPHQLAGKSGLEIMQEMMRGELPYAECAKSLSFCAIKADAGYALFQGTTSRSQLNPMGIVHGGWISSVLDSASGCAVLSTLPPGAIYSTIGLDVKYRKFLTLKTVRVRAEARVTRVEGRDAFAEATLFGPDDTVFAEASSRCRLAEIPSRPQAQ